MGGEVRVGGGSVGESGGGECGGEGERLRVMVESGWGRVSVGDIESGGREWGRVRNGGEWVWGRGSGGE